MKPVKFNRTTISNESTIQSLLDDEVTLPLLVKAIDLTPAARHTFAQDLEMKASGTHKPILATLAYALRRLSAMDIDAIKLALA